MTNRQVTKNELFWLTVKGKPLPFESAIERIVRADPEADALMRSEAKQGVGSHSKSTYTISQPKNKSTMDKLASGLGKLDLSNI